MSVKQKSQDKNNKTNEIDNAILRNFDIKKRLGKGAYGIVWQATDKKTQQIVAVKKIFEAFRNETDAQRTFREIMFLRAFRNHPNIIQLHSIHRAVNNMDIYLSFEYMESDLHNVIKRGSILKDVHKRFVMYQLFNAIQYIHSGNVIHRDMKPSNVLVDSQCKCKIADFGLARSVSPNQTPGAVPKESLEPCLTDYVATRWYRAPEILVASKKYTKGIDMWSLGCILGEMIRGKPLFPGTCTVNQIERIIAALPEATEKDIMSVGAGFGSVLLNNQASTDTNNLTLDVLLSGSPADASQLVKSLLVLNPHKRLTAKEAMGHKYIEKFRNTMSEEELTADILPPFRDDIQLSVSEYRSKLYEIMASNEKIGYMSKNGDKKDLNASLTVTCSNGKKTIFTQVQQEADKKDTESKMSQIVGDTKNYSQTLPKKSTKDSKEKNSYQNGRVPATTSTIIPNKSVKITIRTQMDNNSDNADPYPQKTNFKNIKQTASTKEINQLSDEVLRKRFSKAKLKNGHSNERIQLERRGSMDSSLAANISKKINDRVPLLDRRPSVDSDARLKMKFSDATSKLMPSMSKYKILKTLQQTQSEPNRIANKPSVSTSDKCCINKLSQSHQNITSKKFDKIPPASEVRLLSGRNRSQSEDYYESRFKAIEERIRKHKSDYKDMLYSKKPNQISGGAGGYDQLIKKKSNANGNLNVCRNRSEYATSAVQPQANIKKTTTTGCERIGGICAPTTTDYKFIKHANNYGIITASDLFKIRSS